MNFKTILEGKNVINNNAQISNSKIGYGSYIGSESNLNNTLIGRYCSIGETVKVIAGRHPTKTFVSTHPAFFSTSKQAGFTYVEKTSFEEHKYPDQDKTFSVIIGNDVWIGADVKILEGVNIGDGVVIATGAVVINDLEPYSIYGGVPAKKIGERFSEFEKRFLLKYKWWDKDKEWIEKNALSFSDIDTFINIHAKEYENSEGMK
ncbi:CatB-related O-acetyltransferase [Peribacillus sp. YIM B13477]|uniref:CatB-related O-acetyltransferase n=1 Tax=Peribacillus sp. YIM B13477 TaxID=3366300 RepID=UPI00366FFA7B